MRNDPRSTAPSLPGGRGACRPEPQGRSAPGQVSTRRRYPSDLTDRQWESVARVLEHNASRSRPTRRSLREIADAVNYRWSTGCSWRMLPHDFPPWTTVYTHFHRWRRHGTLTPLRAILLSGRRISHIDH